MMDEKMVEAIKVLTDTLLVLKEARTGGMDKPDELEKAIKDKIFYISKKYRRKEWEGE